MSSPYFTAGCRAAGAARQPGRRGLFTNLFSLLPMPNRITAAIPPATARIAPVPRRGQRRRTLGMYMAKALDA